MTKRTIGEFMALLRKAAGYTQQEVAEKLNISNRTLSSWETDRTVPDVLMLPAIAELYGVTVDELLRGERNQSGEPAQVQLSEKSQRLARKNRYGKFIARSSLYTGLTCLCGMIFLLAGILFLFTYIPFWVSILLWLVGGLGAGVFIILIFYELNGVKIAEGIVIGEDFNAENKAFTLHLKRKVALYLAIISIPFLIGTIVFSATYVDVFSFEAMIVSERALYIAYVSLICVYTALGFILLATALLYANSNFKNLANEKQLTTRKTNAILAAKIFGFGAIPVAVIFVLTMFLICIPPSTYKTFYKSYDQTEFITHMQTLTVEEGDYFNTVFEMEPGSYPLNFPKQGEEFVSYPEKTVDLGYGFYCLQDPYYYYGTYYNSRQDYIRIYKLNYDSYISFDAYYTADLDENGNRIGERFVVNAAYRNEIQYDNEVFGIVTIKYCGVTHGVDDIGHYTAFYTEKTIHCDLLLWSLFIAITAATLPTCVTVYIVKRKKQNYSF